MAAFTPQSPLAEAVGYEMKNKPPGSDLVVANSSETIIPAADCRTCSAKNRQFPG
jgi:hypothetical protein